MSEQRWLAPSPAPLRSMVEVVRASELDAALAERDALKAQYDMHHAITVGVHEAIGNDLLDWRDLPGAVAALKIENAAERAHADRLAEALRKLMHEDAAQCGNELGEEYIQCNRCNAQEWGSVDVGADDDLEHNDDCVYAALTAHDARRQPATEQWVCPTCGDRTKVDEDGCCKFCGEDCTIEPLGQPATEGGA